MSDTLTEAPASVLALQRELRLIQGGTHYLANREALAWLIEQASSLTALRARLVEAEGWHRVVMDCERIVGAEGTAESPLMSNLPNIVRDAVHERNRLRDQCSALAADNARLQLKVRGADALADAVAAMVTAGQISSRSVAADALQDYREEPRSDRSDACAMVLAENARLRAACEMGAEKFEAAAEHFDNEADSLGHDCSNPDGGSTETCVACCNKGAARDCQFTANVLRAALRPAPGGPTNGDVSQD